jgi:hypothetical protein
MYHVWSLDILEESAGGGNAGTTTVFAFNNDPWSLPDPGLVLREVRPNNVFIRLESATRIGTLPLALEDEGDVKDALMTVIR